MPFGKKCKVKAKSTGKRCGQAAVKGYSVCRVHGAGTKKRVKEGIRKSPSLAPIRTGQNITPKTEQMRRELDPLYKMALREVEQNPALSNLDAIAKRIYATARMLDYENSIDPPEREGRLQAISYAVSRVEQIRTATGGQSTENMRKLCISVAQVFREFVPPERLRQALISLRQHWDKLTREGEALPTLPAGR